MIRGIQALLMDGLFLIRIKRILDSCKARDLGYFWLPGLTVGYPAHRCAWIGVRLSHIGVSRCETAWQKGGETWVEGCLQ
jgi:hypothetical protein